MTRNPGRLASGSAARDARVVDLDAYRRSRMVRSPAPTASPAAPPATDCGSGWYHEAAIREDGDAPHAA